MSLNVTGFPDKGLLRDDAVFKRLEPLAAPLTSALEGRGAQVPGAPLSGRTLAQFVYDLQTFQEKVLGVSAAPPENAGMRLPVRIPASLLATYPSLSDFGALGEQAPLFAVLKSALGFLAARGEAGWAMDDASKRSLYVEMVAHVRTELRSSGLLPTYRIAAASGMTEAESSHLATLARQLECSWVDDAGSATHVLLPSDSASDSETQGGESEYFRSIAHRGKEVLIHVWYRPDSYDTWLPDKDFAEPEPAPAPRTSAWRISSKWLRDSARYNELMNEEDYELEDDSAEAAPASAESERAKKHSLPETVADDAANKRIKLHVAAKPQGSVPVDLSGSQPIPGKKYESEPIAGGTLGNLPSHDAQTPAPTGEAPAARPVGARDVDSSEAAAAAAVSSAVNDGAADPEAAEHRDEVEQTARKYLAAQTQEVIVPSYSTWFDPSTIHAIERRSLPEFFNNRNRSKTPSVYKLSLIHI